MPDQQWKKRCVIKLDDFETTKSTGGIVVWVGFVYYNEKLTGNREKAPNEGNVGYLVLDCSDDTQVGWIYQDKTNILRNPNL